MEKILKFILALIVIFSNAVLCSEITINADMFEIDGERNDIVASGNVEVRQQDIFIQGQKARYNQLKRKITVTEKVSLEQGNLLVTCESLVADQEKKLVILRDNIIFNLDEITGSAQEANYYIDEKKIELLGRPEVKQGKDLLTGNQIIILVDRKKIITRGKTKVIISSNRIKE